MGALSQLTKLQIGNRLPATAISLLGLSGLTNLKVLGVAVSSSSADPAAVSRALRYKHLTPLAIRGAGVEAVRVPSFSHSTCLQKESMTHAVAVKSGLNISLWMEEGGLVVQMQAAELLDGQVG